MIFAWSAVLEKGFYAVWGELRPCSGIRSPCSAIWALPVPPEGSATFKTDDPDFTRLTTRISCAMIHQSIFLLAHPAHPGFTPACGPSARGAADHRQLLRRPGIGNLPLRCQRCGNTTPIIGVKHLNRT